MEHGHHGTNLDITASVESIELVEELKHGALDFTLTTGRGIVPALVK